MYYQLHCNMYKRRCRPAEIEYVLAQLAPLKIINMERRCVSFESDNKKRIG